MKTTIFACITLLAAFAFAGNEQRDQKSLGTKSLGFEEIKIACQTPARYHNQAAPSNIQISCKDIQYKWMPDTSSTMTMSTSRQVTASVYSDKYSVSPMTANVQSDPQAAPCSNFKQVAEVVETVRAVSCDEIISYQGSATDFCVSALDSLKGANASAVSTKETGQVFNTCDLGISKRSQRDQRDQRDYKDQRGQW